MQHAMQENPFAQLPKTAAEHFKLYFYAAVLHLLGQISQSFETQDALFEQFPFLIAYHNELMSYGLADREQAEAEQWWKDAVNAWEKDINTHLPLLALRHMSELDYTALVLLMSIGLSEEDARFGLLFEAVHGLTGQHRPTLGLLNAWWREPTDYKSIRALLRQLQDLGLVSIVNPDAPRIEWALQIPGLLWDVLRDDAPRVQESWLCYRPPTQLLPIEELVISEALHNACVTLPPLLANGEVQALAIRGPQHNGRRTLLGAIAHKLERGLLEITGLSKTDDERWRLIGPLSTLLHALPAIVLDLAPGETLDLPTLYGGPIGIILGKQGGVNGPNAERTLTLTIEMPTIEERRRHWERAGECSVDWQRTGGHEAGHPQGNAPTMTPSHQVSPCGCPASGRNELRPYTDVTTISERFRLTSGNIARVAHLAQSYAALAGHTTIPLHDVQQASRALNRQVLETLATHVQTTGDWSLLAVNTETLGELFNLEQRCRHREQLHTSVGVALSNQLNPGVRALLSGPSGTGKTLAARLLASVLQMDLYKLDLSSVINKYIGETEKSLNQIFARAEEMDVILLLDEGDALLTQRTNVQTSNDRYANLETNYLLQRLEEFEGILIVTTNAGERIDSAFQRRMDIVVEFRPPEATERWVIWQLHLPKQHSIEPALLREVAARCLLSGGQIRNAVLHASLLALNDGSIMASQHLEDAIQREYRKMGGVCPLRRTQWGAINQAPTSLNGTHGR